MISDLPVHSPSVSPSSDEPSHHPWLLPEEEKASFKERMVVVRDPKIAALTQQSRSNTPSSNRSSSLDSNPSMSQDLKANQILSSKYKLQGPKSKKIGAAARQRRKSGTRRGSWSQDSNEPDRHSEDVIISSGSNFSDDDLPLRKKKKALKKKMILKKKSKEMKDVQTIEIEGTPVEGAAVAESEQGESESEIQMLCRRCDIVLDKNTCTVKKSKRYGKESL